MRLSISRLSALVATIGAALCVATPAHAAPAAPTVPGAISVPAGHKPFLVAHATGVQAYVCQTRQAGYTWGPATPLADLFSERGNRIGTHSAGPTWQADDGSTVVGSRVDGVNVDPTAIDWLLINADSATAGPDGDRLAPTKFIQRINTVGGRPPVSALCNEDTVWSVATVPYTADYVFWKERA